MVTITPTGTADDSVIIQNAINALSVGGTLILSGNFLLQNAITLKSNMTLQINNKISLNTGAVTNIDLINFDNCHDIIITGGELVGKGSNYGSSGWGIRTTGSSYGNYNITISNLKAHDFRSSGVALNSLGSGGLIENCTCNNNGMNGIGHGDTIGTITRNCYCNGNLDAGIQYEDCEDFEATNNQCTGNYRHNLQVEHGDNGTITGGVYSYCINGDGIQIRNRASTPSLISDVITISQVNCHHNSTNGLTILSSNRITVTNGDFNNNGDYGIEEKSNSPAADYNIITNNDLISNNSPILITGSHTTQSGNSTSTTGAVNLITLYFFGDAEPTSTSKITTVFNAAKTLSPTGVISACFAQGDMTKDNGGMNYTIQALNASSLANVPSYFVIGNHEYNNRSSAYPLIQAKLGKTYTLSKFSGDSSNNTYSFNIGGIHVVVLNIYYNNSSGAVSAALYSWLDADLAAASGFKVVCAHDPMYPKSYHVGNSLDANKSMRDQLQAMFVRNKVNVFMGGHEHYSGVQNISGVYHVCTGSIIPQGTGDKFDTLNYIHINSSGDLILTRKQNKSGNWTNPSVYTTTVGAGSSVNTLPDMTPSELAAYNGLSGQPSYVAVSGIVYDVSDSSSFSNGKHKSIHTVGQDLTSAFLGKHAMSYISSFPKVANLIAEPTPGTIAKWKCSGPPNYAVTRDDTLTGTAGVDYYLSEALAKAACKRTPQPTTGDGWVCGDIPQTVGEWYKLNMGGLVPVKKVFMINSKSYPNMYPRNFQITASADNSVWDDILSMSGSESVDLIVDFPGNLYKYIKIVLTGTDPSGNGWAIGEMSVYTERQILAKYTDDTSVATYGIYEGDPIKDPKITSKGQAFARAVEEISMRKNPILSINSVNIGYYFDVSPNELITIIVPGTSISQEFVVQKISFSEGCYGTWNEVIELREI